jgi:hypothetical protein
MLERLKFRVWDHKEQKFFQPIHDASNGRLDELLISLKGDLIRHTITASGNEILEHESCFLNRYEINQFTGFKDCKGNEIYVGDLYQSFGNIYQVFFCSGAICGGKSIDSCSPLGWEAEFDSDMEFTEEIIFSDFTSRIKIIGNVYQHEKMIKNGNTK